MGTGENFGALIVGALYTTGLCNYENLVKKNIFNFYACQARLWNDMVSNDEDNVAEISEKATPRLKTEDEE